MKRVSFETICFEHKWLKYSLHSILLKSNDSWSLENESNYDKSFTTNREFS